MALIPTTNGSVSAFASSATHLIVDISGYFASPGGSSPTLAVAQSNRREVQSALEIPAEPISSGSPEGLSSQSDSIPPTSVPVPIVPDTPNYHSADLHSTAVGRAAFVAQHGSGMVAGAKAVAESVRHSQPE